MSSGWTRELCFYKLFFFLIFRYICTKLKKNVIKLAKINEKIYVKNIVIFDYKINKFENRRNTLDNGSKEQSLSDTRVYDPSWKPNQGTRKVTLRRDP